ncbi:AMP-binding enzyme [Demequina sp.]|uniref:AMP-binding enzyme n=1 Tax=Demequina sp. TaxID=2050685 RepID=UPI003D0ABAF1
MQHARLADNPRRALIAALTGEAAGIAVETSGSTGEPREVLIDTDAVIASARATTARLGGPGSWLLSIPPKRIGGALVIARTYVDGTELLTRPSSLSNVEEFAAAARELEGRRRYTSLVPTQVVRFAQTPQGRTALASFDAVLVGGAPLPPLDLDANLISTYGATETCGGCVYDGVPLDGVDVAVVDGVVRVAGPTLAQGYADGDDSAFVTEGDERWWVTPDIGTWDGSMLEVHGRVDDAINTGGFKAHPARLERALDALPYVSRAAVAGVADPEWGERVTAWVVPASGMPSLKEVREDLKPLLTHLYDLPRELRIVEELPLTEGGKIDRRAMRTLAAGEEQ